MSYSLKRAIAAAFLISQFVNGKNIDQNAFCDAKLNFAHVLCRHGDRNIATPGSYPNDPWKSIEYWPGGYGQLTNIGKQQHYELGKYLRDRYAKLLGDGSYSVDKIYTQSTDIDRVLMSASACLAGLFPPNGDQIWKQNLDWQPIPVHTTSVNKNDVLEPSKPCSRYNTLLASVNKKIYDELAIEYNSLIKYLEKNAGIQIKTLWDIRGLYDILIDEKSKNFSMPLWTESILNPGGDFGQESTLANMLSTLGLFKPHTPPFASCIFFEQYQCADESYVQIFYKNTTTNEAGIPPQDIPNCGMKCPIQRMYELYDDVLPKRSYDEECEINKQL